MQHPFSTTKALDVEMLQRSEAGIYHRDLKPAAALVDSFRLTEKKRHVLLEDLDSLCSLSSGYLARGALWEVGFRPLVHVVTSGLYL